MKMSMFSDRFGVDLVKAEADAKKQFLVSIRINIYSGLSAAVNESPWLTTKFKLVDLIPLIYSHVFIGNMQLILVDTRSTSPGGSCAV